MFKILKYILFALMPILLVIDFFMPRHHIYFWWDNVPAFYAIFAFASCLALLVLANGIADILLRRKEDYYD